MTLPSKPLPTGTVDIAGTEVPIRGLSRSEVLKLRAFDGNEDDAEPFVVAAGTGVPIDEAREWLANIDVVTGGRLLEAIFGLSGLMADPQTGSTGDGPAARPSSEP